MGKKYYKQAEKYGTGSIKELQNGRFRFYEELKPARTQGEMAGARHVREWDPYTGYKRDWYETTNKRRNNTENKYGFRWKYNKRISKSIFNHHK